MAASVGAGAGLPLACGMGGMGLGSLRLGATEVAIIGAALLVALVLAAAALWGAWCLARTLVAASSPAPRAALGSDEEARSRRACRAFVGREGSE